MPFISFVKAGLFFAVILSLASGQLFARDEGVRVTGATTSAPPASIVRVASSSGDDAQLTKPDIVIGKNLQTTGALERPSSGRRILQLPQRIFHLINPFAPVQPQGEILNVRSYSPRAWASSVGWHLGGSAFPDELTHESTMGLNFGGGR